MAAARRLSLSLSLRIYILTLVVRPFLCRITRARAPNLMEKRGHPSSDKPMADTALANAEWWSWFWGVIEHGSLVAIVLAGAVQIAALKRGASYKQQIENAREERIATLSAQAIVAESEIAKANSQAATALMQAKEAELKLEQLKRARAIDFKIFKEKLSGKPPLQVEIFWLAETTDGVYLAGEISQSLHEIGWPDVVSQRMMHFPDRMTMALASGGAGSGIVMTFSVDLMDDNSVDGMHESFNALFSAITACLGAGTIVFTMHHSPPKTVRMYIGPRL
jgi:hypothetical protein